MTRLTLINNDHRTNATKSRRIRLIDNGQLTQVLNKPTTRCWAIRML